MDLNYVALEQISAGSKSIQTTNCARKKIKKGREKGKVREIAKAFFLYSQVQRHVHGKAVCEVVQTAFTEAINYLTAKPSHVRLYGMCLTK